MRKFIVGAAFTAAFVVCAVESFYGDPSRLITYGVIMLFMWGTSWICKKLNSL